MPREQGGEVRGQEHRLHGRDERLPRPGTPRNVRGDRWAADAARRRQRPADHSGADRTGRPGQHGGSPPQRGEANGDQRRGCGHDGHRALASAS